MFPAPALPGTAAKLPVSCEPFAHDDARCAGSGRSGRHGEDCEEK